MAEPTKKGGAKKKGKTAPRRSSFTVKRGPVPVRFEGRDQDLLRIVQARAASSDRSLSGQIKHYLGLAVIAEDNSDLSWSMVQRIGDAREEFNWHYPE